MKLLIDIGNTRLKWGIAQSHGVIESRQPMDYKHPHFTCNIQSLWSQISTPNQLAISSVSQQKISLQLIDMAKKLWPDINILIAKTSKQACSVTNGYQSVDKLGIDRWLGLIALHHYYPNSPCFIDCGTAITIDFIDKKGFHQGGLISAGLELMKHSLIQGTADLCYSQENQAIGLSTTTTSAIHTGTLYAAVGLINHTLHQQSVVNQPVILTGGDALLIAQYLNRKLIIEADFVLKGLFLFCVK